MLSLSRLTDGQLASQTDRQTTVKQYAPDLSIRGHNNVKVFTTTKKNVKVLTTTK